MPRVQEGFFVSEATPSLPVVRWPRCAHGSGCGRMFCDDCTSKRYELPATFKIKGKQRVCDDCYYLLVQVRALIGAIDVRCPWTATPTSSPPGPVTLWSRRSLVDVVALKAAVLDRIRGVLRSVPSCFTHQQRGGEHMDKESRKQICRAPYASK